MAYFDHKPQSDSFMQTAYFNRFCHDQTSIEQDNSVLWIVWIKFSVWFKLNEKCVHKEPWSKFL
jgi:hypothetical protein